MDVKAAVAFKAGEPLSIETVQLEGPKEGEVLVEMKATGICHTDSFTLSGDDPEGIFPSILGHEGAGVIVEVGTILQARDWYQWSLLFTWTVLLLNTVVVFWSLCVTSSTVTVLGLGGWMSCSFVVISLWHAMWLPLRKDIHIRSPWHRRDVVLLAGRLPPRGSRRSASRAGAAAARRLPRPSAGGGGPRRPR